MEDRLVVGSFSKVEYSSVNLGSTKQLKKYLLQWGWKPTEFNESGEPKLVVENLPKFHPCVPLLQERSMLVKRKSIIEGWLSRLRPDGRLTAGANTCGTNTGRMRHRVVANVPKVTLEYGEQMRAMFCAPECKKIVGHDLAGIELRLIAHYAGDQNMIDMILNGKKEDGTDIHSFNRDKLTEAVQNSKIFNRDEAKTEIYAFAYDATAAKLGASVGLSEALGAVIKKTLSTLYPGLKKLTEGVKRASKRGWLRGLDGRRVWMRRYSDGRVAEHKALNTLIQSAGAIIHKKAMVILDEMLSEEGLDYMKVIDMHDEQQNEVAEKDVERFSELAILSVVKAGEFFNLRIPLDAEVKVGNNWAETH